MRTECISVFQFSELSETAKERAREWYRDGFEYPWASEARESIKRFKQTFLCVDSVDWQVGPYNSFAYPHLDGEALELSGARLYAYLVNNYWRILTQGKVYRIAGSTKTRRSRIFKVRHDCPFTGFCIDDDLLEPLYKFLKGPKDYPGWATTTYRDVLRAMADSWADSYSSDWEYLLSDEAADESMEINKYEFTADGKPF